MKTSIHLAGAAAVLALAFAAAPASALEIGVPALHAPAAAVQLAHYDDDYRFRERPHRWWWWRHRDERPSWWWRRDYDRLSDRRGRWDDRGDRRDGRRWDRD